MSINAVRQKAIELGLVSPWPPRFLRLVKELKRYKKLFGHCQVPQKHKTETGYHLGREVSAARTGWKRIQAGQKAGGGLNVTPEMAQRLDQLGFIWDTYGFEDLIKRLKKYDREVGDMYVPFSYECPDGYPLGRRVRGLRARNSDPQKEVAIRQRLVLDAMGFPWKPQIRWFCQFEFTRRMASYKERYGTCVVSLSYKCEDGYPLHRMTSKVRAAYKQGDLDKSVVRELERVGFPWDLRRIWIHRFLSALKEYKQEYGNLDVLSEYVCPDGYKLGQRVSSIRVKKNRFLRNHPEAASQLDSMGFLWENPRRKRRRKSDA